MAPLVFVSHAWQAEDLLRGGVNREERWIALGPSAMDALDQMEIRYSVPADFCLNSAVEDACVEAFESLRSVSEQLDRKLQAQDEFLRHWGIGPFALNLWDLARALDGIVARDLYLRTIHERHPDTTVIIHRTPRLSCYITEPHSVAAAGTWDRLLETVDYGWSVDFVDHPAENVRRMHNARFSGLRRSLSGVLQRMPVVRRGVALFRAGLTRLAWRSLFPSESAREILVLGGAYDWARALASSAFHRYCVRFETRADYLSGRLAPISTHDRIAGEALWSEMFEALNRRPGLTLLREAVIQIACQVPAAARSIMDTVRKRTARNTLAAVLNSTSTDFLGSLILHSYRALGVPVLKWQHGSAWYRNRINQRFDLADLSEPCVLLVYGPSVKAAYERDNPGTGCRVVCAGSPRLDRLARAECRRHSGSTANRILYVVTNYYCDQWYCGFSPPFSDTDYYRDQMAIVRAFQSLHNVLPHLRISVKLPPNYNNGDYVPPWAQQLRGLRGVALIETERSYADLLLENHAVVIDSPTTTLLEALSTRIPAFVLTRNVRWPDESLPDLRRRAVCEDDPERLMQRLESYIRTGEYGADCEDRSFIRQYGTHTDDGHSADRGVGILLEAIGDGNSASQPAARRVGTV